MFSNTNGRPGFFTRKPLNEKFAIEKNFLECKKFSLNKEKVIIIEHCE